MSIGPEVPEADAAEQLAPAVPDDPGLLDDVEAEMRARGGDPRQRVGDLANPVNPADAAEQAREIGDDDERRD